LTRFYWAVVTLSLTIEICGNLSAKERKNVMSKIIELQAEKEKNIERLNKLGPSNKIQLFWDEVRMPKQVDASDRKQRQIGKAIREAEGDVAKAEKILREKGLLIRKSPCYERMILKDCHLCETNILHPQVENMEEADCIKGLSPSS
jgi:hypothetical protein